MISMNHTVKYVLRCNNYTLLSADLIRSLQGLFGYVWNVLIPMISLYFGCLFNLF